MASDNREVWLDFEDILLLGRNLLVDRLGEFVGQLLDGILSILGLRGSFHRTKRDGQRGRQQKYREGFRLREAFVVPLSADWRIQ